MKFYKNGLLHMTLLHLSLKYESYRSTRDLAIGRNVRLGQRFSSFDRQKHTNKETWFSSKLISGDAFPSQMYFIPSMWDTPAFKKCH